MVGREEKWSGWELPVEEADYMGLEILPGEWEVHIGHPSPGFWLWEDESFYVAYTSGTNRRAEETNFTCEEHTHLLLETAWRKQIETARGSGQLSLTVPVHTPALCCYHSLLWLFVLQLLTRVLLREVLLLVMMELVWTWCCIWRKWGQPLFGTLRIGSEKLSWVLNSVLSSLCQDCPAPAQVGGVEHTLGGSKTRFDSTLRASASAPWDPPIPLIGWWWPLSLEEPCFTPGSDPWISSYISHQGDRGFPSYPGEDVTIFISDLVPSTKPQGICRLHRDAHTQRLPFKIRVGNCFTFHRDRKKLNKLKRQRNMFLMKEQELPSPLPQEEHLKKQR